MFTNDTVWAVANAVDLHLNTDKILAVFPPNHREILRGPIEQRKTELFNSILKEMIWLSQIECFHCQQCLVYSHNHYCASLSLEYLIDKYFNVAMTNLNIDMSFKLQFLCYIYQI